MGEAAAIETEPPLAMEEVPRPRAARAARHARYSANFSGCAEKQFSDICVVLPQCLHGSEEVPLGTVFR